MSESSRERVGFIGVGNMGGAMLRCVREAGFPVVATDVSRETLDAVATGDAGVATVDSPAAVAQLSRIVCLVVQNDAQAKAVLLGRDGLLAHAGPEHLVVIHSTLSLGGLRRLAEAAEKAKVALLDAGVSGRQGQGSVGDLCVMVGGPRAAFEQALPVLETYGGLVLHLGDVGAGMRAKLARNTICYLSYLAMFEGLALAETAGIERGSMDQILEHTGLRSVAMNAYLDLRTTTVAYDPDTDPEGAEFAKFNALIGRKDLESAHAFANELGIELPGVSAGIEAMDAMFGAYRESER